MGGWVCWRALGTLQDNEDGSTDDTTQHDYTRPNNAPEAGYEADDEAHDDYGAYSNQPMTFDNLPHMGTLPPMEGGDTEPYSSGEGEVRSRQPSHKACSLSLVKLVFCTRRKVPERTEHECVCSSLTSLVHTRLLHAQAPVVSRGVSGGRKRREKGGSVVVLAAWG